MLKYLIAHLVAGFLGVCVGELCVCYDLPPRKAYPLIVGAGLLIGAVCGATWHLW